jgi:hypothetical protein
VDPLVSIVVPAALFALAYLLARRELRQYRAAAEIGSDLFVYSRGRLVRRLIGVGLLVLLGGTLAALGLWPAATAAGLSLYLAALATEVLCLVVLPLVDLWETARTARPHDLTRQAGARPRTRSRSRLPP